MNLIEMNPVAAIRILSETGVYATTAARHYAYAFAHRQTVTHTACVNNSEGRAGIAWETETNGVMCHDILATHDRARQQNADLDVAVRVIENCDAARIGLCRCG